MTYSLLFDTLPIFSLAISGVIVYNTICDYIAGWSSPVARRAHNPKVAGSNPAPATI